MIDTSIFYNTLVKNKIHFFTGVPDSLLKDFCAYVTDYNNESSHIIAANEGSSIAIGIGSYLSTGNIPLIYMQNSGFGNSINPLLSLADPKVYSVPMLIMIGWRGEPNVKDEPQHVKQGEISEELLKTLSIPYIVLSHESEKIEEIIKDSIDTINKRKTPFVFLVKKNTFSEYKLKSEIKTNFQLNREDAIKYIVNKLDSEDIVVSTTGKASRELFEYREEIGQTHERDFLTVGGMGHANQIALGIAINKPDRKIFCIDGDGAVLMHTGAVSTIGDIAPKNFRHIIINNGSHDSVGGQSTVGFKINFSKVFEGFNYKNIFKADSLKSLNEIFDDFSRKKGPNVLEILVNKGSRNNLGRPTKTPIENKESFINFINKKL